MTAPLVDYDFAVLRVVPRVHLGAFVNVGVVVHARTAEFLAVRVVTDVRILAEHLPGVDVELLARYLRSCEAVAAGEVDAGPMALAPPSERFHWLTAPRSDVLQSSPVHEGICDDPRRALDALFDEYVTIGRRDGASPSHGC
ncbi:MAG TPA: DUF3037 domain-containing protein [Gemmatimonadaceae bacterium]|jgi:hypothetical protein|nr:DUF3037 domain-containing protein [Gemmatimonadaceae bacterium]